MSVNSIYVYIVWLNIESKAQLFPEKIKDICISNEGQISLYLILKILFPPLWSNMGRKMLREFHFAGTSVP